MLSNLNRKSERIPRSLLRGASILTARFVPHYLRLTEWEEELNSI